jgi:hypothetical protein
MSSPTKIEVGKPTVFLRKARFGYKNKAHDYEDATWDWVTKRGYKPEGQDDDYRNITLAPIRVVVWDEHRKPINPQLILEFPPTKEGLRDARSYARQILESGAIMADVDTFVNFPSDYHKTVESQQFLNRAKFDEG